MSPTPFSLTSGDGLEITAYRWDPPAAPVGIVQLTHGMGEHVLRYEELAQVLTGRNLVVYGQDHRGHGASADPAALGDLGPGGWPALVADIGLLTARAKADHPGLPLILLGHSMGSFAVQQYLLDHSGDSSGAAADEAAPDAVVLTGTGAIDLLEPALDLDQPLDLTMFNAAFQPARTPFDWLTRDDAIVDAYIADPRCGFGLGAAAARAMFAGARPLADPARVNEMRDGLPVYVAGGELDPVNGGGPLLEAVVERYRAAGLDVTVHVYPGGRHEILNETNRPEVFADLTSWLDRHLAPAR